MTGRTSPGPGLDGRTGQVGTLRLGDVEGRDSGEPGDDRPAGHTFVGGFLDAARA
jgi:hypothetical protein